MDILLNLVCYFTSNTSNCKQGYYIVNIIISSYDRMGKKIENWGKKKGHLISATIKPAAAEVKTNHPYNTIPVSA